MNHILGLMDHPASHRLGWTLFHSLWQGALAAGAFAIISFTLRRRSAQARYLGGCVVLAMMAMAPLVTFMNGQVLLSTARQHAPLLSPGASSKSGISFHEAKSLPWNLFGPGVVEEAALRIERALTGCVATWIIGVSAFSLRWVWGLCCVRRMRTVRTAAVDHSLIARLEKLKARLEITRPVRLLKSALVDVPTVVGWLRPAILLPAGTLTGLTPAQLEAILAHELAHIRRYDYLVNTFQILIETLMFYHPAVWWVSRRMREEREHCCDDLVVRVCGNRLDYARALVNLEESRGMPQLALAATGGSLLLRVRRMLGGARDDRPTSAAEWGGLTLLGLGFALVLLGALAMLAPVRYLAVARLRIERDVVAQAGHHEAWVATETYDPYFVQTEFEVMCSPKVLGQVVDSLKLDEIWSNSADGAKRLPRVEAIARLKSRLVLGAVRNTNLIDISASDRDPALAASIANAVAIAYQNARRERRSHGAENGIKGTEAALANQDAKIRQAKERLDTLRAELKILDPQADEGSANGENVQPPRLSAETLRRVENLRIEQKADYIRQKTLYDFLAGLKSEDQPSAIAGCGIQDGFLTTLCEQLNLAEQKALAVSTDFGENHPELIKAKAQVNDLRTRISERSHGTLLGLQAKMESIEQSLKEMDRVVEEVSQKDRAVAVNARPYLDAKRQLAELQRYRAILEFKISSERTDAALPLSSAAEIVDEAIAPPAAVSPNPGRAGALAGSGLLMAFSGVALLKRGNRARQISC